LKCSCKNSWASLNPWGAVSSKPISFLIIRSSHKISLTISCWGFHFSPVYSFNSKGPPISGNSSNIVAQKSKTKKLLFVLSTRKPSKLLGAMMGITSNLSQLFPCFNML